jgi:hypothetical protein
MLWRVAVDTHTGGSAPWPSPLAPPTASPTSATSPASSACWAQRTKDLAELLEVEPATIADWIAGFPDFAMALKQGREIADATAAERLFQRAIGFSHEVEKVVQ